MTNPIMAFLIVFLALSKLSGLPVEVMYWYPPLTKKKTAAAVEIRVIIPKVLFVYCTTSDETANTGVASIRKKGSIKPMIVSNFFIKKAGSVSARFRKLLLPAALQYYLTQMLLRLLPDQCLNTSLSFSTCLIFQDHRYWLYIQILPR